MYVKEILTKEEEKHRLIFIGIIDDWTRVVGLTENTFSCHDVSFTNIKMCLLNFFYSSILNYENFIEKEKTSNINLRRHHFRKTRMYVSTLSNGSRAELDKELKTPAEVSFAWHFSNMIYDEIFDSISRNTLTFKTPQETDHYFFDESKKIYPLLINQVINRLEADDSSFWDICAQYIQDLSRKVINYLLQRSDNYGFSDLIKDQTWTDTHTVLRSRLIEKQGKIPKFENGRDFRNYLIKVCNLIAANLQRKYVQKDDYIEDLLQMKTDYESEDDIETLFCIEEEYESNESDYKTYGPDINADNPYEVAHAVSIILLNSSHPFHTALIEGIEDKVRILIDKAIYGMNYNDIISEQYDKKKLSEEDFRRAVVKARKDYERVRKILCDRLRNLLKKKN